MKKIKILFVFLLAFTTLTLVACKNTNNTNVFGFSINEDGSSYCVTKYTGTNMDVVIPSEYKKMPVTSIGEDAFDGTRITSVVIPDSVTSIGKYAFSECFELENIVISKNLNEIGKYAFNGCSKLQNVYFNGTAEDWFELEIKGNNNTNPMQYAKVFYVLDENGDLNYNGSKYSTVKSMIIPEGATEIDDYEFSGFVNLTSIVIPQSVTKIGRNAFYGCSNLTNITLPKGLTYIDNETFRNCTSLTSIVIPEGVKSLGWYAFGNCQKLVNVKLPNTLKTINENAFSDCVSLKSIEIPSSVIDIRENVLSGCKSLETISLPFVGDSEHPNQYPFGYLFGITYYEGSVGASQPCYSSGAGIPKYTIFFIPEKLNTVIITGGYINHGIFSECGYIETIKILCNVTSIGESSFSQCRSLTSIEIPNGVRIVPDYAFYQCINLKSVIIPSSVINIMPSAFEECKNIEAVYYTGTKEEWGNVKINSKNTYLEEAAIYYYSETNPTTEGNYWFYNENGDPTVWSN